jgi:hypothetical protein
MCRSSPCPWVAPGSKPPTPGTAAASTAASAAAGPASAPASAASGAVALRTPRHGEILHRPAHLCVGHRLVHHGDGRGLHHAAADRAVPAGGTPVHRDFGDLSRRLGPDAGGQRAVGDRAGDERLARPDLHGSRGTGQWHRPDHAELPARHQRRPGPGGRAEPPVARRAAPALGRDAAGRARGKGPQQLPAVRHPVLGRPGLGPGGAGRLRRPQRAARDPAPARRGPGAAVRHRARHAHLDRPGQAARA